MRYYKAEDVIRKRAEDLADTSYWEWGNPENVDEWIEVAEMEFADLPSIDIVRCKDCSRKDNCEKIVVYEHFCGDIYDAEKIHFCEHGERKEE